ncbi:MAG: tetratricopeptide repeat protein [Anaerolineae bacterium]|nr:tetratricopeptide repeat protein [Anaerolineae bacterium]
MVDSKIRKQLIDLISQSFNATDLQGIYLAMGLDYDSLSGGGVQDRATELVEYLARRDRLPELLHELMRERPHLPWPDLAAVVSAATHRLHQIPHPANPHFTGREQILQQVENTLGAGQTTVVTQTIAGLGGVGKTQLALAYSYAHLADYDLIYWLSADSEPGLGEDVLALARRLKLVPPHVTDQQAAVQTLLHWLGQTTQRWLLVYDNADQIEPAQLAPYLPRTGNGHVLITSRNPNYGGLGKVLELGLFSLDEAVDFLFQRRGAAIDPHPSPPPGRGRELAPSPSKGEGWGEGENELLDGLERKSKAWEEAADLAEALGRLPLALEHAAAYVASKGSSYARYHQLFTTRHNELWRRAEKPERYHATITTTWELAFDEIKKTPGALELLNLCCFLDPEGIPLDLIAQITTLEKSDFLKKSDFSLAKIVVDELALDDAIGALRRYSLVQRADGEVKSQQAEGALTLHRLVQAVARSRMDDTLQQNWLETAVALLRKTYRFNQHDMSTWPACGQLLPHLIFATDLAEKNGLENNQVAFLNNEAGFYLQAFGNYAAARPYFERALAITEKALGPDHPDTAQSLNNLGGLLKTLGDLAAARPYFERALAIKEKTLGPDHPSTGTGHAWMGSLLQDMGDLAAARPYLERTLAILEKALGPDHPTTATSLNNLGGLVQAMGDLAAARPYLERALAIREKALGPDHPALAYSLNNLGMLVDAEGDFKPARDYLARALAIFEKALGPNHPNSNVVRNNLATIETKISS